MKKTGPQSLKSIFVASIIKSSYYFKVIKILSLVLVPLLFSSPVSARIPEPDNILYGSITYNGSLVTSANTEITVRFELSGNEIASYQMGSENVGDNFILRVPIDVLEPQALLTARPGDTGQIFITKTNVNLQIGTAVIGQKGSVLQLSLTGFDDSDGDGITDSLDSCPTGESGWTSNPSTDFDGDGCRDATEDLDDDNDGLSDLFEIANGLNPLDATGVNGALGDADGDGFTNIEEQILGTDASAATGATSNPGIISFSSATYSVNEDAGTLSASVTRNGGSVGAVSVICFSTDITSQAVAGVDYSAINATLNWADGDATAKTCDIPITSDSNVETDETFQLDLGNVSGGAKLE